MQDIWPDASAANESDASPLGRHRFLLRSLVRSGRAGDLAVAHEFAAQLDEGLGPARVPHALDRGNAEDERGELLLEVEIGEPPAVERGARPGFDVAHAEAVAAR